MYKPSQCLELHLFAGLELYKGHACSSVLGFKLAEPHVLRKLSTGTGSPGLLPESLRVELKQKHPSCTAQENLSALLEASCCCDHRHTSVRKPSHALLSVKSLELIPKECWNTELSSQPVREQSPSHTGTTSSQNKGGGIPQTQGNTNKSLPGAFHCTVWGGFKGLSNTSNSPFGKKCPSCD